MDTVNVRMLSDQTDELLQVVVNPCLSDGSKITLAYLKQQYPHLFYTQDWYDREPFMHESFESGTYTLSKSVLESSRGKQPPSNLLYPASLIAFVFIAYYQMYSIPLWPNDYIWCSTFDSSGDQVYVGRYQDPLGISKDGFSIHRHLTIKNNYGWL